MKRSIEEQQPPKHDLDKMRRKLARSIAYVDYMQLDHIEYNPNYIGLFAHVIYRNQPMCFLVSYNQLRRDGFTITDLSERLLDMVESQRKKRYANRMIEFSQGKRIRRKAAGES